ncbi:hypothetical protein GP486_008761 [Trichoglossum hirsutum]|uniref:Uncharacterized protein n=1 Tax=Trichoglossum hirsutum TaxID=265104 RepID=A0A9P8I6U5_9PEZI|nr:hypothetical protein GP486_008761 [Trichoglossum hirsutum]
MVPTAQLLERQTRYNNVVDDVRRTRLAAVSKSALGRVVMVELLERLVAQNEEIIGLLRYQNCLLQVPDTEEPEFENDNVVDGDGDAEDEDVDLLDAEDDAVSGGEA